MRICDEDYLELLQEAWDRIPKRSEIDVGVYFNYKDIMVQIDDSDWSFRGWVGVVE